MELLYNSLFCKKEYHLKIFISLNNQIKIKIIILAKLNNLL